MNWSVLRNASYVATWWRGLWDRPIPLDDEAKITAWVNERRERDADLTFHIDRDITDHRPTAEHIPTPPDGHRLSRGRHATPRRRWVVGNVEDQAATLLTPDKPHPEEPM